ncbi:MAG TPA: hypothetical protein VIX17_11425 [Pyrinomonadaceae bacterium]|jgi:hypothetical protein
MLVDYKRGTTSIILRVKLRDSAVSTGAGKTGLTSSSSGLIISTIANNESTPTVYAQASSNVESITTLGTFAAPTSGKCRFKEVDATNHKGIYEIQIADARFAVSSARTLLVSISGVSGVAETDFLIPLRDVDPYDSVRFGMAALPSAAAEALGGLYTRGTGAGQINQPANGMVDSNVVRNAGSAITSASGVQEVKVQSIAANAITDAAVDTGMDSYTAKVWVIKESTTTDHYAVRWFKNGVPITSGITSPTIQVIKASDGTDLIASTSLTEIGSTHYFKKDESTNKLTAGQIYFAKVSATIDSSTRTFDQQVGRDSA